MARKIDWEKLARASLHPLKIKIIEIMLEAPAKPWSPSDLADRMGDVPLGNVSYHVRQLHDRHKLIEMVKTAQVRGTVEHFYKLTPDRPRRKKPDA